MSKSKQKGTTAESAVADYLNEEGFRSKRSPLAGAKDEGDVYLLDLPIVVEVKNRKRDNLNEYVDEALAEAENAKASIGIVWHKRIRKGQPKDWFVTMNGSTFIELLKLISKE